MSSARRACGAITATVLSFLAAATPLAAQSTYPNRPIKLIVPFPPGGVYDVVARPLADKMRSSLGTVVIENIGGAGGTRGVVMAMRAPTDGYTLLLGGNANFIVTPLASRKPAYDPVEDFEPIARIATVGLSFVATASLPVKDLAGLIAYAKTNPGKVSFGTPGIGTTNHFVGEMLKAHSGASDIAHVPYAGAGPAMNDLAGGHIPLLVANITGQVLEMHRAGKAQLLAVTTAKRMAIAPDVPTAEEAGFKDLIAEVFFGLFAPRDTPAAVVSKVTAAVNQALDDPDLREIYAKSGFETERKSGPAELKTFLSHEIARWRPIIETSGFKIE